MEEDYGVNLYSTFYRKYDPQIGRFSGVDSQSEASIGMSVYQFGGNNPVSYNDPLGNRATSGYYSHPPGYVDYSLTDPNPNHSSQFLYAGEGGGGGGGSSTGDYSAFWSNVLDAAGEFFNSSDDEDQKNYPLTTIDYFFSKAAYLAVEGIGAGGVFNISGTITTLQIGDRFVANISIGAWSPAIPDNSDGGSNRSQIDFYGNITLYANGSAISRQKTNSDDIFNGNSSFIYSNDGGYPMPGASFDLPSSARELGIGFSITYQYFPASGGSVSPTNIYSPGRAWLNAYQIIYSNYPSK